MSRITRTGAVTLILALVGIAHAQTAARNPQRPQSQVESKRTSKEVLRDAARIDAMLARGLKRHREEPQPLVDDATFVRRAYLNVTGRIPTLSETEKFLADQDPDKRFTLCDSLLNSPGRTSHFSNYWFDLLRVKTRQRQLSGEPFAHFIRKSVLDDVPYDEFVREMLIADGPAHEQGNGATGHLMRDTGMPHDSMANTVRLFLGTRLECAQCHNHPFDHWTQKQFFEMAAFFGNMRYRDNRILGNYRDIRKELANEDQRTRQRALNLVRRVTQGIQGSGSGTEKLPKDYQYDDARPLSSIKANTIFGSEVKLRYPKTQSQSQSKRARARRARTTAKSVAGIDARQSLADWLTDAKNPQFAKVIANRMWARTFGRGLVEPRDDWKKATTAVHPEVLTELEKLMVKLDFDLRQFERVLLHTKLFQRTAAAEDPQPGQAPTFSGPVLRRMSAQQVWDSLLTLVYDDLDERLRALDERATQTYASYEQIKGADKAKILEIVKGGSSMMQSMQKERRKEQRSDAAREKRLKERAQPKMREMEEARRDGDQRRVARIATQLEQMGVKLGQRAAKGSERDLLRASDLAQPASASHLLRQFGQSDRETIDGSIEVATVPQVLTLLNGFLDQRVISGESALRRDLQLAEDGARRVRIAFLTTLNREPNEGELNTWRRQIAVNGQRSLSDLVWVLCNSNEFRFVR